MKNFDLDKHAKKTPFGTPEGYFENFAGNLEGRIQGETIPKNATKKLPFGIPSNYFELLPQYIAKRIENLIPKVWYKQIGMKWALAGSTFSICAVLVWLNFFNTHTTHQADKELAENLKTIPQEELIQYLAYHKPQETLAQAQYLPISQEVYQQKIQVHKDTAVPKIPKNITTEDIIDNDLDRKELEKILEEELEAEDLEDIINP
ncbi:MAG: hypothetical protein MUC49_14630 [Raineya sp.]|jgi:hypothetical protein|nr:hypothetical protein [Raineya sp.]